MKCINCSLVAAAIVALAITSSSAVAAHLAPNLFGDPGFEDPAKYTFDGAPFVGSWEGFSGSPNASSMHDTTMPRNGQGHATLSILGDDNSFAGVFQSIDVVAGQTVSAGVWHKTPVTALLGVASEFRIEWHEAGGAEIGRVANNLVAPTNEYTLLDIEGAIAPLGAVEARMVYAIQTFGDEPDGGASNSGTVYLDDAAMAINIPEPTSIALMGLAGLSMLSMRRHK